MHLNNTFSVSTMLYSSIIREKLDTTWSANTTVRGLTYEHSVAIKCSWTIKGNGHNLFISLVARSLRDMVVILFLVMSVQLQVLWHALIKTKHNYTFTLYFVHLQADHKVYQINNQVITCHISMYNVLSILWFWCYLLSLTLAKLTVCVQFCAVSLLQIICHLLC